MAENGLPERVERVENKLDALAESVDKRFDRVDRRFADIDQQFLEVREHFVEQRQYIDFAYDKLDKRMTEGFSRLERKFDQFIDARSRPASVPQRRARPSKRRR